ncbi:phosphatidylinositol 3-kinase [Cryptosporidium ryanae]|uniref:phosphatidylinositol 3-kinase n=1 Tax=Cryptosporidium ryanae TaxID=515981 RepID=UPI00351A41C2|nr:phosphatidylinositol 3-kinase [Cryptosporidium ryanae]
MFIKVNKIIISSEILTSNFAEFAPALLRIQCELFSVNSFGDVSELRPPIQSEVIKIDSYTDESKEFKQIDFFFEMHINELISFSPFCNYSIICLFNILNENAKDIDNFKIGYSVLPIFNIEGYVFLETMLIPIVPEYQKSTKSLPVFQKNCIQNYKAFFPMEYFANLLDNDKLSNLSFGYMVISINLNRSSTLSCFKRNKIFSDELNFEYDFKINYSQFLNFLCRNSDFLINQKSNRKGFYLKVPDYRILSVKGFYSTLNTKFDNPRFKKGIINNEEKVKIELNIMRLYTLYISVLEKDLFKEEVELLWEYRYILPFFKGGIPMLLDNINLKENSIIREVEKLLEITQSFNEFVEKGNTHIEDSLNLLSCDYKEYEFIREFAIKNLKKCTRDELKLILPQLVQSLRYEVNSELSNFLKKYVTLDLELSVELLWLLVSEISDLESIDVFERTFIEIIDELVDPECSVLNGNDKNKCCVYHRNLEIIDLFLSQLRFRLTLLWIHNISIEECKRERLEKKIQKFQNILQDFEAGNITNYSNQVTSNSQAISRIVLKLLNSIKYMVFNECKLIKNCKKVKLNKSLYSSKIVWELKHFDSNNIDENIENISLPILNITNLSEPLPLPIDINKALIGIVPNESFIIKSSLCPFILSCRIAILDNLNKPKAFDHGSKNESSCVSELIYPVIESKYMYKVGDDLRQDQLVIQLLEISSKLLEEWNLTNSTTTYKVLSFSKNDGLIFFLEDFPSIGALRKKYGKNCILQYWAAFHNTQIDEIPESIINRFIISCAVYSVATFIVGVGDRHLDNLLVGKNGDFLHVDFGYIFGEDPKPFPPPMKVCTEMIEAMGGINSYGFKLFVDKCCEFYRYIRRRSWLFINLLLPMVDSGIKDFDSKLNGNHKAALIKIKEKFRLELSEMEAEDYLREIIMTSSKALFPAVVDTLHEWALYWK